MATTKELKTHKLAGNSKNNLVIIDGYTPPMDMLVDKEYLNEFIINGYSNENHLPYLTPGVLSNSTNAIAGISNIKVKFTLHLSPTG